MKKTLLAVAIPALFAASAQAVELYKTDAGSVEFYGQLRTELKKSEDSDATLGAGSSRAGFKAQYDVNEDFYVHGLYEFGMKEGDMTGRLHYAGFGGDWGKVSLGQQWTLQDDIYGADWSYFFGGTVIRYTPIAGGHHSNLIKYGYEADQYAVHASYGLDEDNSAPELAELFGTAVFGDFDAILGFASEDFKETTEEGALTGDSLETTAYTASLGYTFDKFYVQGTYYRADYDLVMSGAKNSFSEDAFGIAATWAWADNATAYVGYEYVKNDASKAVLEDIAGEGATDNGTLIYVGTDYHLNDWSRIYVEYAYGDGTTLGYENKDSELKADPGYYDSESLYAVGYRVYW